MKRLLLVAAVLAATAQMPAWGEELSAVVKTEAVRLKTSVDALKAKADAKPTLKPQPLPAPLTLDLQRFGLNASRLSVEIDQRGGPTDLRCIFRGMAEETDVQLKAAGAAGTNAAQADALDRLSHMLRDAAEIAPAVALPAKTIAANPSGSAAIGSCPAVRF